MSLHLRQLRLAAFALLLVEACLAHAASPAETPGQYFQMGVRGFTPAGKTEPQTLVVFQIDMATRKICESRVAALSQNKDAADAVVSGAIWCSSISASTDLKYHGVFRNRINGKTVHIEADNISYCNMAAEFWTGPQAPNNKVEVVTECQAR